MLPTKSTTPALLTDNLANMYPCVCRYQDTELTITHYVSNTVGNCVKAADVANLLYAKREILGKPLIYIDVYPLGVGVTPWSLNAVPVHTLLILQP